MKTDQFFIDYEKYTSWVNAIVQNVKTQTLPSVPVFSGAQATAAINSGGTVINQINIMRTEVYAMQGITQSFASYDDTVILKTYQFLGTATEIKTAIEDLIAIISSAITANETEKLIDSLTNEIYIKTVAYTNAEAAVLVALTDLLSVINYVAHALTNVVPVSITGTLHIGDTLTAVPGAWTGNTPINKTHQWVVADDNIGTNAMDIVGQTGLTYIIAVASGKYITVKETATEVPFNYQTATVAATYVGPVV